MLIETAFFWKNNESAFFWKINLKSKYITRYIRKGLTHSSTNPAWQSLTWPNKQDKGTVRMLWTETKTKIPINDIAKITWAADFGDLNIK